MALTMLAALLAGVIALAAQAPANLSLDEAVARALSTNRTVLAAGTARAADVAGIAVARQRPNPEISAEAARETPHWAIGGTLPIEVGGKRQRRIDVANATLSATEADIARTTADVRADVRRAYYEAVAGVRRLAIMEELEALAARAQGAAQERFQSGAAPRLEALQAALALAQARNEVASARGQLAASRAELNALLAYPPDAVPSLSDALDAGPLPTLDAATQQALSANAELVLLERQIAVQRAKVSLARALRHPDPAVSATFTYDAPGEFTYGWRLGGAIALPIFTSGRSDVAVAEANLAHAIAEKDARSAQIAGAVASAVARARAARDTVDRYRSEILPASLEVERLADESYRAGQTGLPAYLQTVQAARDARQRALQAALDYQLALAELERAMGTALK
jgi:cobalt-zinc-cadmium efflux system outer membrane protein